MAAEKKSDKERSVEERLKALYQLQTILSEIDRIRFLRGELPNEVKDLEDEIIRYQTRIQKYSDEIVDLREIIATKKKGIEERRVKIARYDTQIDNVRNNREFAFLERRRSLRIWKSNSPRRTSARPSPKSILRRRKSTRPALTCRIRSRAWKTRSASLTKS